jgi:multiple sugar transport system substrate-binding protein
MYSSTNTSQMRHDEIRSKEVQLSTLTRRDFLRVTGTGLVAAGVLGGVGCGGGQQGGVADLTLSCWPDLTGTLQNQIKRFNRQNKGEIRVDYRRLSPEGTKHFDQVRTELQGGGGNIDVIIGEVTWPTQFAASGWIVDLSDRFTEDMRAAHLEVPLQTCAYEGKFYGVPWMTDAGLLYYRKDLLEQSGFSEAPRTWDELKEMAQKVKRDSGTRDGLVFQGAEYASGVLVGLEYIWGAGGYAVAPDDPQKVVIDSPEAVRGLQIERSMVTDGISPRGVADFEETETHEVFLRGDSVFARNWPYMYGLIGVEGESGIEPGQVGVSTLPAASEELRGVSGIGGWNMLINATTEYEDAAWSLIEYLDTSERQRERFLEASLPPTHRRLYDDKELLEKSPYLSTLGEALQGGRTRPTSTAGGDIDLLLAEAFNDSLRGDISPEQAVEEAQKGLEEIFEQT